MAKILVSDPIHEAGIKRLEDIGHEVVGPLDGKELEQVLPEIDGAIVRSGTTVDETFLNRAEQLQVIGRAGVGVDNIDLEACKAHGVVVFNTPQASTQSVAELTIAHLLSVSRTLPRANLEMREGKWPKSECRGDVLDEKTLGLVGIGRIGARVAQIAQAFGMTVHAYDPYVDEERADELGVEQLHENVIDMAGQIDAASIHTPLTSETEGLVDQAFFGAAPDDLIVVNCARGGVLDEDDLLDALESGHLAGAGLDVYEEEPPGQHPLFDHPRVSITPHIGAQTEQAQRECGTLAASGVMTVLDDGAEPDTRVA
jgi:D-3-phosphoglycerate dehydrogenase